MTGDTAPQPWTPGDSGPVFDPRRHAPATLRNRDFILPLLREELPDAGSVLEIASGSGEHVIYFARALPTLDWQPSDPDPAALGSIVAHIGDTALTNIREPASLDASAADWPVVHADAILCVNMVHISPWLATVGLFAGAARLLADGAPLILYGPFIEEGVPTAASNLEFDANLRARDPQWGLRAVHDVAAVATDHGFAMTRRVAMPANNIVLVWRR